MYRHWQRYEELDKMVCDIYCDYGFSCFPIDVNTVCSAMGLVLVPYSDFKAKEQTLLKKKSKYGFYVKATNHMPPKIFYNDDISDIRSLGCIRQTIFHEIKHYVCDDDVNAEDEDDLAEHFGRYFMCPTPYLVINDIIYPDEIASRFNVSMVMAENVSNAVKNRISKHGHKLFEYEKPLIRQLDKCQFDKYAISG